MNERGAAVTYTVTAKRWEHGWELHIHGVGVTQSRTVAGAEDMIRDYLRCDGKPDWDSAVICTADSDGRPLLTSDDGV